VTDTAERPAEDPAALPPAGAISTSTSTEADADLIGTPPAPAAGRRRWLVRAVVAGLLAVMGLQMVAAARSDTATYDEPVNVRSGIVYALDHDLTPNPEHPPLTKLLSGWTVRLLRPDPRGDLSSFSVIYFPQAPQYGKRALAKNERAQATVRVARIPSILLALLFGLVVYLLARDLFGRLAGVVALGAYAFAPELVAHGHLATNDLPAAGLVLTALWCVLRTGRSTSSATRWRWLAGAGLALGAGLATKYQVALYAPAVALAAGYVAWRSLPPGASARQRARRTAGWVALLAVVSVAVVWAVTAVADPSALLHAPPTGFGDGDRSLVARLIDWLPLPAVYRAGLRYQNAYSRVPKFAFFRGETYLGHRWWYQPVVLTMKYPVVTLALWAAGVVAVVRRRHALAAVLVLLPAAVVLGLAMAKGADIGDRYAIGTPILLAVVAGAAFAHPWPFGRRAWPPAPPQSRQYRLRVAAAGVVLALLGATAWGSRGHEIAYVNRAWGGTGNAYQLVSDSGVDWGQDLGRLAGWLRQNAGNRPVYLDYFGTTLPSTYGIDAIEFRTDTAPTPTDGIVVLSVSEYNRSRYRLASLGRPIHQIGGSILIFSLSRPA